MGESLTEKEISWFVLDFHISTFLVVTGKRSCIHSLKEERAWKCHGKSQDAFKRETQLDYVELLLCPLILVCIQLGSVYAAI